MRSNVVRDCSLTVLDADFSAPEKFPTVKRRDACNRPYDRRSMTFSLILCQPHVRRGLSWSAATLLIVCAGGCASPGQPRPPSLNLPETVNNLMAERVGDLVQFHWTTPEKTTDHIEVKGPMTAEICRSTISSAQPSPTCLPVVRLAVQPGLTHAQEALPPILTANPPTLLAYRLQIFNAHGRSAGPSPEVFVASGAAPPLVDHFQVAPTADGAVLEWRKADTTAVMELDRLPVASDGTVAPIPPKTASKSSTKSPMKKPTATTKNHPPTSSPKPPQTDASTTPTEVKLRTPTQLADAGGTIDHTARMGESYRYTAQRIRSVTLGGHTLELRSFTSTPVTVIMRNTFPPHAPTGLEAVPGGATAADRSIDLSWIPNTEADLAGYIVYRQEIDSKGVAAGTATRLNPTPVVGPAYRDQTATAGRRYAYQVTAVDTAGNESAPSDTVQETLREQ
jgi:hypothetical protein